MPFLKWLEARLQSFEAALTLYFRTFLFGIGVAGVLAALGVLGVYYGYFHNHNLVDIPARWNELGGFIGGCLGPIFGFLSLLALILTLWVQANALKTAQEESARVREEQTAALAREHAESNRVRQEQANAAAAQGVLIRIHALTALMDHMRDAVDRCDLEFKGLPPQDEEGWAEKGEMDESLLEQLWDEFQTAKTTLAEAIGNTPEEFSRKQEACWNAEGSFQNAEARIEEEQNAFQHYRATKQRLVDLTNQKEAYAQELQRLLDGIRAAAA